MKGRRRVSDFPAQPALPDSSWLWTTGTTWLLKSHRDHGRTVTCFPSRDSDGGTGGLVPNTAQNPSWSRGSQERITPVPRTGVKSRPGGPGTDASGSKWFHDNMESPSDDTNHTPTPHRFLPKVLEPLSLAGCL